MKTVQTFDDNSSPIFANRIADLQRDIQNKIEG